MQIHNNYNKRTDSSAKLLFQIDIFIGLTGKVSISKLQLDIKWRQLLPH